MTQPRFAVPRNDRRDCALYRIDVLHPVTGKVVLGYIGETARMPFTRFVEHLYDQPWGDTVVGHPRVDPRPFSGKAQVLAAEQAAVRAERPLYNVEHQRDAPHRITPATAREQRARRDHRRGAATPDWSARRGARIDPVVVRRRARAVLTSAWTWWLLGWAAVAVALGWLLDRAAPQLTAGQRAGIAVVLATAGVGRLWWQARGRRAWRRFHRRHLR